LSETIIVKKCVQEYLDILCSKREGENRIRKNVHT